MKNSIQPRQTGLSLLEALTTMSMVTIFASTAVPSLQSAMHKSEQSACLGETISMLSLGRQEAVTLQQQVAICGSSDEATCNTNNWEEGWVLFVDDGTGVGGVAGDLELNGDEQRLRVSSSSCGTSSVRSRNFADAGAIAFTPDGLATDRGTLVVCGRGGTESASAVILNISGQPRMATDDNGDGIVEQDDGDEVSCS